MAQNTKAGDMVTKGGRAVRQRTQLYHKEAKGTVQDGPEHEDEGEDGHQDEELALLLLNH